MSKENKPHYPWKIDFSKKARYTAKQIETARKIIQGGTEFDGGKVTGKFARHEDANCTWEQISLGYPKSVVTCPYFIDNQGEIYVLFTKEYFQPAANEKFDETPRGFALIKKTDNTLETTLEATERILKSKLNLPINTEKIFRLAAPINPDPSWFEIPHGLSMVAYEVGMDNVIDCGDKFVIDKEKLLDPKGRVPEIMNIKKFLGFEQNIESGEKPRCGLSQFAALSLLNRARI